MTTHNTEALSLTQRIRYHDVAIAELQAERRADEVFFAVRDRRQRQRIVDRLATINGKAYRKNGECAACGEDHGTIVVKLHNGGEVTHCPLRYYISKWIECLHMGRDLNTFMQTTPLESFLCGQSVPEEQKSTETSSSTCNSEEPTTSGSDPTRLTKPCLSITDIVSESIDQASAASS